MKVLAVGDIHTKAWILDRVEALMDEYDEVILIGDYADDFNSSHLDTISTWLRVKAMTEGSVTALLGNHEYHYLKDVMYSGYDRETQSLLDSRADLKEWLTNLPVSREIDGVTYSHAGFTEEWSSYNGLGCWSSPIWARPGEHTYINKPQVVGHTPVSTVMNRDNMWFIDTFSTYRDGRAIGDHTVLEVIDGKEFNIRSL